MSAKKQLDYTPDPNKFDRRTHVWDAYGRLTRTNLYRTYFIGSKEVMERPVGSGNLWDDANQPAGRVEATYNDKGCVVTKHFDFEAAHIDFTAPLSGAEKLHYENEQLKLKMAKMEDELAAVKDDQTKKNAIAALIEEVPAAADSAKSAPPSLKKRGAK